MDWRSEEALKQHAYIFSQCVLALATIEGMKAENVTADQNGVALPYGEKQFTDAMAEFAIDSNTVIEAFKF